MGATKSVEFIHHHFPPNHRRWRRIYHKQTINDHFPMKEAVPVVVDDLASQTGEMYTLKNFHSLQYQLQTILFRKQHTQCIVTVYDVLFQPASSLSKIMPDCVVGQNNSFTIIIEHIPYRLSDIGMLRFPQMLYILDQCFKGLDMLWRQFGKAFYIDEEQICFNSQGHCKIWINESLQKNQQNIDSSFLPKSIIHELFQMLETRLEQIPPLNYHKYKAKTTFDKFIHAVNFLQKVKRLQNLNTDCIKSLKKQSSSDSFKAQNKRGLESKESQQKRELKFSLKNSRNFLIRKRNKNDENDFDNKDRICSSKGQEQQCTRNSQKFSVWHSSQKTVNWQ